MHRDPAARLDLLRRTRVRADPARPMHDEFAAAGRELSRLQRRLGGVGGAWLEVCPASMLPRTRVTGLSRGVATIAVRDAATRYELDGLLRAGLERELVRRCPTTLRKVRLVLDDAGADPTGAHDA